MYLSSFFFSLQSSFFFATTFPRYHRHEIRRPLLYLEGGAKKDSITMEVLGVGKEGWEDGGMGGWRMESMW